MVEQTHQEKKTRNEGVTLVPVVRSAVLLTHRILSIPKPPKDTPLPAVNPRSTSDACSTGTHAHQSQKKSCFKGNRNTMNKSGETFGDLRLFVLETCQVAAVLAGGAWSKKPKALAALGALGEPEC